jgi:multiple sugar transport system ATP-binding protein
MAQIFLDGIEKRFGATVAVDRISLEIHDRDFLVLLGPSGCGKSTLLRILAGLLEPSEGRVVVDGRDVTALPPRDRDVAMVFQSYALYPHMSVARNLGFGLRARRLPKSEIERKVLGVAAQLQLDELLERKPKQLSGGQRQRVALGRAMVREPVAFLMDEPLSNLDAQLRTATRVELSELHRRLEATFVYVTHDQVEAMTMATRIAVLNEGRLEQVGTPAEIYDEPATAFVAQFVGAPPMNLLAASAASEGGRVHVRAAGVDVELWDGTLAGRPVTLGVRPEHLRIVDEADAAGVRFAGRVVLVENLGSEEVAFCELGEGRVAVRGARPLGLGVGDPVVMTAKPEHVRLFDPSSGRRLRWVEEREPIVIGATRPREVERAG